MKDRNIRRSLASVVTLVLSISKIPHNYHKTTTKKCRGTYLWYFVYSSLCSELLWYFVHSILVVINSVASSIVIVREVAVSMDTYKKSCSIEKIIRKLATHNSRVKICFLSTTDNI